MIYTKIKQPYNLDFSLSQVKVLIAQVAAYICVGAKHPHLTIKEIEDNTMSNTHLIWFNGTGESLKDTEHLFENLKKDQYSVVPGWGSDGFIGSSKSQFTAEKFGVWYKDLPDIDTYLLNTLKLLEKIKNKDKVIVGGFSRGSGFFVPYFLKLILENTFNFRKFMIILMDPVTGTEDNNNTGLKKELISLAEKFNIYSNTVSTLEKLNLFTDSDKVNNLIKPLTNKYEVYGIVLCPCFEREYTYFGLDDTFVRALKAKNEKDVCFINPENLYITRMGITHRILSTWSRKNEEKKRILDSLQISDSNSIDLSMDNEKLYKYLSMDKDTLTFSQLKPELQSMLEANLDIEVTKTIFELLLSDNSPKEEFFHTLDCRIDATNCLLQDYKIINYKKESESPLEKTREIKKGMRNIETNRSGKLKILLENWRN